MTNAEGEQFREQLWFEIRHSRQDSTFDIASRVVLFGSG
jgi:hypothetical protein